MTTRRPYYKYLDQGLRKWIYRTAQKNLWRVALYYDLSDLIQDGFLAYAICRERYGHKVTEQKHFMGLVKRVYTNHITDLANARSKAISETAISQFGRTNPNTTDEDLLELLGGWEHSDAEMAATLRSASVEIRTLMRVITEEPTVAKVINGGLRLTTNEKLNAVLGTCGHDFERQLRDLLGLDPGPVKARVGFSYDGNREEIKRTPRLQLETVKGHRKVYSVERYVFCFVPAAT